MDDQPQPDAAPQPLDKPQPKKFRRTFGAPRPDPALVNRQMEVTTLAFRTFGGVEGARAFLNEASEPLGGRPIDIAGASAEGLQRVVAAMASAAPDGG